MVLFNYATKELTAKVVYYGPGLCGKTTNLQHIYDTLPAGAKGKMLSLATKTDRTLFFDFLPIDLGTIRGMKTKIQLYTVPGQVFYDTTRKLVLKGADGVVFVADSQEPMVDANIDSFENLIINLAEQNLDVRNMPHVIQFNKRDMKNALPVTVLNAKINRFNVPYFEGVAPKGVGVFETLKEISKLVLKNLGRKYGMEEGSGSSLDRPPPPKAKIPNLPPKPKPAQIPTVPNVPEPEPVAVVPPSPPPRPEPKPDPPPVSRGRPPVPEVEVMGAMDEIEFLDEDLDGPDSLENLPDEDDVIEWDDDVSESMSTAKPQLRQPMSEPEARLLPIPSIDDSEVIEMEDGEALEVEELDDMAAIAEMASEEAKANAASVTTPIEVPISINLPSALAGRPLNLQINITFDDS